MVGTDPPLRLYSAPPRTRILKRTPLSMASAQTFLAQFLADAKTSATLDPAAKFTHDGLTLPHTAGSSTGTLAILALVERGLRGEDALEEARALFARLEEERREERAAREEAREERSGGGKGVKTEESADGMVGLVDENGFKWEDKSVLELTEQDGSGWAEQDDNRMLEAVPEVKHEEAE
jgi:hypothetical protein